MRCKIVRIKYNGLICIWEKVDEVYSVEWVYGWSGLIKRGSQNC